METVLERSRPNWNDCLHVLPVHKRVCYSFLVPSRTPSVCLKWGSIGRSYQVCLLFVKLLKACLFHKAPGRRTRGRGWGGGELNLERQSGENQWVTGRAEVKGAVRVHRALTLHNGECGGSRGGSHAGLNLGIASQRWDSPVMHFPAVQAVAHFHSETSLDVIDSWCVAGRWSG